MKTILNILIILLVAAIVSGGLWLVVNNTSVASGFADDDHQSSSMTNSDGTRPERPEGMSEHGASLTSGLAGIFGTLIKLTIIIAITLIVEKGTSLFRTKRAASPA